MPKYKSGSIKGTRDVPTSYPNSAASTGQIQNALDKIITAAKEQKPLERRLKTLKLERQYFLDKFPLVGFFKKWKPTPGAG